jgi:broad specificity phosphatase PhoE
MPRIDRDRRLTPGEFGRWIAEYNAAGIDMAYRPPPPALQQAAGSAFVVCSDLPRSLESAEALGVANIGQCDSMFREMDMPYARSHFPRLPLPAWMVIFRLMWITGYSAHAESFANAKQRARRCADRLVELASAHGSVLLVGHGSLNWFVARHLQDTGWSGPRNTPRRYWEFGVYVRHPTGSVA